MERVWEAGLAAPWVAVKDRVEGLMLIADGAVTVTDTGTVIGFAPVAVTVMDAVYVLAGRLPILMDTVMGSVSVAVVPEVELTVNQS